MKNKYIDLLISSINNELYIDNDVRMLYIFTMLLSKKNIDSDILRNIRTKIPNLYANITQSRLEGKPWWRARVQNENGDFEIKNLRNYIEFSHSMIGRKRLENIVQLIEYIKINNIDGDMLEAGIWRGGSAILAKACIEEFQLNKKLFVADSFMGLPKPTHELDIKYDYSESVMPILSIAKEEVINNFKKYNLYDDNVIFIEGWFNESLKNNNIKLSLLRVDGDLYESTKTVLEECYKNVTNGGAIIIDDYGDFPQCKFAVDEFRINNKIIDPIVPIDWTGIYWIKNGKIS
jgi:O-methyltransferase